MLINKCEDAGFKYFNDSKAFIEYSNNESKISIVFDDMIGDILSNKKLNPVVMELFIKSRKLNISVLFITKFYLFVPKNIRLNSIHYFITKIQTNKSFNKLHLIIYQILVFKTL